MREAAIEEAIRFLKEDSLLKQRVHNLGPYAYTHIDWEDRQAHLLGAIEALGEALAVTEREKA